MYIDICIYISIYLYLYIFTPTVLFSFASGRMAAAQFLIRNRFISNLVPVNL